MDKENLEKEYQQLESALKARSEWLSMTGHELRTSLTANKWILKMFLDGDFGTITPEQATFLKKAADSTERMIDSVNDMLVANHTQDAVITYKFTGSNIERLIEDVLFLFNAESYKKRVELFFIKSDNPLPPIFIDEEKIRIVLENVIENAIKYSDEDDKVIISAQAADTDIRISVKDTGIGIPQEEQNLIFTKHYRATNAQKRHVVGNGIGLYTSRMIVEKHGGTLTFTSSESEGTTMVITLPRIHIEH
jgi:signal transduction histidine kinase